MNGKFPEPFEFLNDATEEYVRYFIHSFESRYGKGSWQRTLAEKQHAAAPHTVLLGNDHRGASLPLFSSPIKEFWDDEHALGLIEFDGHYVGIACLSAKEITDRESFVRRFGLEYRKDLHWRAVPSFIESLAHNPLSLTMLVTTRTMPFDLKPDIPQNMRGRFRWAQRNYHFHKDKVDSITRQIQAENEATEFGAPPYLKEQLNQEEVNATRFLGAQRAIHAQLRDHLKPYFILKHKLMAAALLFYIVTGRHETAGDALREILSRKRAAKIEANETYFVKCADVTDPVLVFRPWFFPLVDDSKQYYGLTLTDDVAGYGAEKDVPVVLRKMLTTALELPTEEVAIEEKIHIPTDEVSQEGPRKAFLGYVVESVVKHQVTKRRVYFPLDILVRHAVTYGVTRSGKSMLALLFIREALHEGVKVVLFDPHGSIATRLKTHENVRIFRVSGDITDKLRDIYETASAWEETAQLKLLVVLDETKLLRARNLVNCLNELGKRGVGFLAELYIGGMACAFCASTIEKGLRHVSGVGSVKVLLESGEVFIRYNPSLVDKSSLKSQIQDLGYYVFDGKQNVSGQVLADTSRRAIKTWILVGLSFLLASPMMLPGTFLLAIFTLPDYSLFASSTNLLIATIALFYLALPIQKGAVVALRRSILNEHVLYGVAGFASYALGIVGLLLPQYGAYRAFLFIAILLTGLHLTAGWLGAILRNKAEQSVKKLMELRPPRARVIRQGSETLVPVSDLQIGDVILVKPGEKVPLDGVVIDGRSEVSEAILTGESTPILKRVNDDVLGGSTNGGGALVIKVSSDYSGSYVSRLFNLISSAKEQRSSLLTFFDKVVDRIWVPLVLLISFGTFAAWMLFGLVVDGLPYWQIGIVSALLVMVIGYPCAIGFSTPSVGLSVFSEYADNGVIVKDMSIFEKLKDVKTVIFDKTGTLTYGSPRIIQKVVSQRIDEYALFRYAAAVEKESSHPIAKAIVDEAETKGVSLIKCEDLQEISGSGVTAAVEGRRIILGTPEFLVSNGLRRKEVELVLHSFPKSAASPVVVAVDSSVIGAFDIADTVREDAKPVIEWLNERGIKVLMLTGDSRQVALQISQKLGGIEFLARQSPDDKINIVRKVKQDGKVLMVGDGINDAASLAAADVGIATAASIDVSKDVADAVLVSGGLSGLSMLIENAGMNARASAANILLALSFNAGGIPLAISGALSVSAAMLIMVASLLGVFLNAYLVKMRLKRRLIRFRVREVRDDS